MRFEWTVSDADAGRRLDRFLLSRFKSLLESVSSSRIQRMLRKGDVKVNGIKARPGVSLRAGDRVVAHHPAPGSPPPTGEGKGRGLPLVSSYEGPPITVLHESYGFLVVNKPAGVSCDHGEGGKPGLLNWAWSRYEKDAMSGKVRPAAAHRLDAGTTGTVCLGLTARALESFRRAQEEQRIHKLYWIVVWGRPLEREFELSIPLRRLPHAKRRAPKVVAAEKGDEGLSARTRFRWIAAGDGVSLLQAEILTGRTHQIRAHCRAHGLPIVGDPRYGDRAKDKGAGLASILDHQLLHARQLELADPSAGFAVTAQLPTEYRRALRRLRIDWGDD